MSTNPVDDLLRSVESASWAGFDGLADDAVLDATVPDWRFVLTGGDAVRAQFAQWFRDPSELVVTRQPLPSGELVEVFLSWEEPDGRHWANQVHVLDVADGRITKDRFWCGGRWNERQAAEMGLLELVG